ncbi:MAG: hypothetical protein JSS27_18665 [Planctomycetes bacterium]|nr:hypothetical protein [Planctomycetota bacterium]
MPEVPHQSRLRRWTRRLLKWTGGVLVVLLVVYGILAWRYWSNPPQIKRNILAELNEKVLAIPVEQRAWPIYARAAQELNGDWPENWVDLAGQVFTDPDVPAYLARHAARLAEVREASHRPKLGFIYSLDVSFEESPKVIAAGMSNELDDVQTRPSQTCIGNPPIVFCSNDAIFALRILMRVLAGDAVWAASQGDGDRAAADLEAMIAVAGHGRAEPVACQTLVADILFGQAIFHWAYILEKFPSTLTANALIAIEKRAVAYVDDRHNYEVDRYRLIAIDMLQRICTDDGHDGGCFFAPAARKFCGEHEQSRLPSDWLAPVSSLFTMSRHELHATSESLLETIEREDGACVWMDGASAYTAASERIFSVRRNQIVSLTGVPYAGGKWKELRAREQYYQQVDALRLVSAVFRFREKLGHWPRAAAELVPVYLPKIPVDRFNGEALRYRIVDEQPLVYSVGFNRRDDGGIPLRVPGLALELPPTDTSLQERGEWRWILLHGEFRKAVDEKAPGDWILWPATPRYEKVKNDHMPAK